LFPGYLAEVEGVVQYIDRWSAHGR
jgi:hypothetical protein